MRVTTVLLCDDERYLALAFTVNNVDVRTFRSNATVRPDELLNSTICSHSRVVAVLARRRRVVFLLPSRLLLPTLNDPPPNGHIAHPIQCRVMPVTSRRVSTLNHPEIVQRF